MHRLPTVPGKTGQQDRDNIQFKADGVTLWQLGSKHSCCKSNSKYFERNYCRNI
jgi:hypothetical protein